LSEEIAGGVYRPGDRLPSEVQLRERFGTSGMTVRRAVNILVDRGLVTASQGKGTFVRGLDMNEALFSLTERVDAGADSPTHEVQLLGASIRAADDVVAAHLSVEAGGNVVYLKRLVLHEGEPLVSNREYIVYDPRKATVEAEMQITSLHGLLQGTLGYGLRRGDLTVEAVAVGEEDAELLGLTVGQPGLRLEHQLFDFSDRPVAWGWFTWRPDKVHLISRIGPDQGDLEGGQ
jgi:DNA-binding GntR family transcriptional regulator